ncbi:hypothetical protein K440DRAFT_636887 [Wilcoxina mikolae CBS 423.85]|nr:hypothetical protein K440DRAFT_636887 [Wilcoxina mikolae CBS 423.85]
MNQSDTITVARKGETFCRPTEWPDVAKFFLFNYGLHAFTVLLEPGSGLLQTMLTVIASLLLPYAGMSRALAVILRRGISAKNPLERAAHASALCMLLPLPENEKPWGTISPTLTNVHGEHPLRSSLFDRQHPPPSRNSPPPSRYYLARVPADFTVDPLIKPGSNTNIKLAHNYSPVKGFVAIFQIVYGSLELYQARGHQLEKYGYAAYSLTVVPYILMSLVNLIASTLQPQYPSMFLVLYRPIEKEDTKGGAVGKTSGESEQLEKQGTITSRELYPSGTEDQKEIEAQRTKKMIGGAVDQKEIEDMIGGAVGTASGNLTQLQKRYEIPVQRTDEEKQGGVLRWRYIGLVLFLGLCGLSAPYIMMKVLTNFENRQSTGSQRAWLMVWIVTAQIVAPFWFLLYDPAARASYYHPIGSVVRPFG